jgi:hypothetical protein
MKKLKPRRYVIVGDTAFYHGDYVNACIIPEPGDDDEDSVELEGRICINKKEDHQQGERHFHFWICQDERSGCDNAEEKFGYDYSWSVQVDGDGNIKSTDTDWITLESRAEPETELVMEEKDIQVVEQEEQDIIDDDPMPEDWTPSEKDMQFLRN